MSKTRYTVFLWDDVAGHLDVDRGRLSFTYRDSAVGAVSPISISLPYKTEPYSDAEARPYFENLLPETEFRHFITTQARIADADTAGILGAIGGECLGAVSIWRGDLEKRPTGSYESTSVSRIGMLFNAPSDVELMNEQRKGRLSLPGALPKLTLRLDGSEWRLSRNGAETTHILKRTSVGFPHLVENEYFCMQLAHQAGLSVHVLDAGIPLLAIERFDRARVEGQVIRIHQEDFCQAAGCHPATTYEVDGGPGFDIVIRLLRENSALPLADISSLIRWAILNYILGNEDAHAKNIALLYRDDGVRLAPFYDIVSTEVYKGLPRKAAMAVGGERRLAYVHARHWKRLAEDVGLTARAVKRLLAETAERASGVLTTVHDEAHEKLGDVPVHRHIGDLVKGRIDAIRAQLRNRNNE